MILGMHVDTAHEEMGNVVPKNEFPAGMFLEFSVIVNRHGLLLWYDMFDSRRVRSTKMKLQGLAKIFWT